LTIAGGKITIAPSGVANGVSLVNFLSVGGNGAQLDLKNNHLIARSTPVGTLGSGNTYTGMSGMIQAGRNGGAWNGSGIVTSQSDALMGNLTSIGVATAQQVKGLPTT